VRYLITGGSGVIGSHLAIHLISRGDAVTVLDLLPSRTAGAAFVQGNVMDFEVMTPLIQHHDAVFHLAAIVGFARVMQEPIRTIRTSINGTQIVLELCRKFNKRLLFSSTSAIYGRTADSARPVHESDPCKLGPPAVRSWCYAYAKAAEECLALAYHQERQVPVMIARLFNTVGPGQSAEAGFVLPRFVQAAICNQPLYVHSPGTQTRTFGHVKDVSEGLATMMECDKAVGEIVNLGGTETISMEGLADRTVELLESRSTVEIVPDPYGVGYENVAHRCPDLQKAARLFGYKPHRTLDEMITDIAAAQTVAA